MYTLEQVRPYLSIVDLPKTELPNFAVLTGKNGSGKTHLLIGIRDGHIRIQDVESNSIEYFDWHLRTGNSSSETPQGASSNRNGAIRDTYDALRVAKENYRLALKGENLQFLPIDDIEALSELTSADVTELCPDSFEAERASARLERLRRDFDQNCTQALSVTSGKVADLLSARARLRGVHPSNLTLEDIEDVVPLNWEQPRLFFGDLTRLFAAYHGNLEQCKMNAYVNLEHGEQRYTLTKEQFVDKYGQPPWLLFNEMLSTAHLDYEVVAPTGAADIVYRFVLRNKKSGVEVDVQNLSSGERVILSVVVGLFNSSVRSGYVSFPKVLLLDETDAPLHPSMTSDLLTLVRDVLVAKHGIRVILTTHSPSTVSLCPAESLYEIGGYPRTVRKIPREAAVQCLTNGIVTVTENTRFVITEAQIDREFYFAIWRRLRESDAINPIPNLVFIQASDNENRKGGGNGQVSQWGQKLADAGVAGIFGIIDRDKGNKSQGCIHVLSRYSVENYWLDPLLIYAALVDLGLEKQVLDLSLHDRNYFEIRKMQDTVLQRIADSVTAVVEKRYGNLAKTGGTFECTYVNGSKVLLPIWLRETKGHDLVGFVQDAFDDALRTKTRLRNNDCAVLREMMCERLPQLIPIELLSMMKALQTA